jgi:hypothetical protein
MNKAVTRSLEIRFYTASIGIADAVLAVPRSIQTYIYVLVHVYVCMYVYIYMYMHIYT